MSPDKAETRHFIVLNQHNKKYIIMGVFSNNSSVKGSTQNTQKLECNIFLLFTDKPW